jgi:hypothetical protein
MVKNKWEHPELIILIRGRPSEAILAACNRRNDGTGGPQGTGAWCCDSSLEGGTYYGNNSSSNRTCPACSGLDCS